MSMQRRPWQKRHYDAIYNMLETGSNKLTVDAAPGSGKTPALLDAISILETEDPHPNRLYVHMAPRVILNEQTEKASEKFKTILPNLPTVAYRDNQKSPIKRLDKAITITYPTFASPRGFPEWKKVFADYDTHLIGDEIQFLAWEKGTGTRYGECLTECDQEGLFRRKLIYSGTLFRTDGLPVSFCDYNDDGSLRYNVKATYTEGMEHEYLRMYCGDLCHATAKLIPWDGGDPREVKISDREIKVRHFLESANLWQRLVHEGMSKLSDLKRTLDQRCQFIVVCADQEACRRTAEFIQQKYPQFRIALAISDNKNSIKRLKEYQEGKFDVLVTCQMAHIGFDAPWSMGIVCLSYIRARSWLDQVIARAMRVVPGIPFEQQLCWWIAPMDPWMQDFMDKKQHDVDTHRINLDRLPKEEKESSGDGNGEEIATEPKIDLYELENVRIDGFITIGSSSDEPIHSFELRERVRAIQEQDDSLKTMCPQNIAKIVIANDRINNQSNSTVVAPEINPYADMTTRERERFKRNQCDELVGRLAKIDALDGKFKCVDPKNPTSEEIGSRKPYYWKVVIPSWRGKPFKNLPRFEDHELDELLTLLREKISYRKQQAEKRYKNGRR